MNRISTEKKKNSNFFFFYLADHHQQSLDRSLVVDTIKKSNAKENSSAVSVSDWSAMVVNAATKVFLFGLPAWYSLPLIIGDEMHQQHHQHQQWTISCSKLALCCSSVTSFNVASKLRFLALLFSSSFSLFTSWNEWANSELQCCWWWW